MGCSGCGGRRKNKRVHTLDAPLIDASGKVISDSFLAWSGNQSRKRRTPSRRRAGTQTVGVMIEPNKMRNIVTLPRVEGRTNILKHSKHEKAVYIIGHFSGCAACRYMHRLIDKVATPPVKLEMSFYSISKNDVQPNGFKFVNNPVIVFVDHGKPVRQFAGMQPNIKKYIEDFYNRSNQKDNEVVKKRAVGKKHVVYKLKPEPTHVDAYEKLLDELKPKVNNIQNITTFMDEKKNLLVVTIDFK